MVIYMYGLSVLIPNTIKLIAKIFEEWKQKWTN